MWLLLGSVCFIVYSRCFIVLWIIVMLLVCGVIVFGRGVCWR